MDYLNLPLAPAFIGEVFPEILAMLFGLSFGWIWGNWQAGAAWKKKEFKTDLTLGFNSIEFGKGKDDDGNEVTTTSLKLRTLFEKDLNLVFTNKAMRDVVHKAMNYTKEGDPILRFEEQDSWYILNTILNQIAGQFAEGPLRTEMGIEQKSMRFLFCVTFERTPNMRQHKPRIMMMAKDRFLQFPDEGKIITESNKHHTRIDTLRQLKKDYQTSPHLFAEIELSF